MELKKSEAIVLNRRIYSEADAIVSLFTNGEGKITAMVKGALNSKRRFGNALEIGAVLKVVYEDRKREMVFLKEASGIGGQPQWRKSWEAITAACFALELAQCTLPPHQESAAKFDRLHFFLGGLSLENAQRRLLQFQSDWLRLIGFDASPDHCEFCRKKIVSEMNQPIFDHYWLEIIGRPLKSRALLNEAFS